MISFVIYSISSSVLANDDMSSMLNQLSSIVGRLQLNEIENKKSDVISESVRPCDTGADVVKIPCPCARKEYVIGAKKCPCDIGYKPLIMQYNKAKCGKGITPCQGITPDNVFDDPMITIDKLGLWV